MTKPPEYLSIYIYIYMGVENNCHCLSLQWIDDILKFVYKIFFFSICMGDKVV